MRKGIHSRPHIVTEYELYNRHGLLKERIASKLPVLEPDILTINILTKDGIIKESRTQPFRSFLANFTRLINYGWMQVGNDTAASADNKMITHVTGGAGVLTDEAYHADVTEAALAPAGANVYGIMVGDMDNSTGLGLTVESGIGNILHYNNWMLRTLLLNDGGSPNTDLEHRVTNLSMPDDDTLVISRRFQNDSASDIFVDECGIIGTESDNNQEFMLARDILPGDVSESPYITVAATEILEISYTFTVTNSGGLTSNWLRYLSSILSDAVPVSSMKDIVNSAQSTANPAGAQTNQDMTAAQDDDTFGIVIGGTIDGEAIPTPFPFSTDDHRVTFKLGDTAHIDHGPMVEIAIDLESTYTQFGMYRDFENSHADDHTVFVVESGLYMKEAALTKYFLIARTLTETPIVVLPDEILRVKKFMKFNL